jgi:hypothetical protein
MVSLAMDRVAARGRGVRGAATLLVGTLLLAGSIWGEDDDFPFGPFRMYASARDANAPSPDTRVEATDATGATVPLTVRNTGIRRAEIEGQLSRFRQDPGLLEVVLAGYARRNPRAPALRQLRIVIRWHDIRDGLPTGAWHDQVVSTWTP